uniref:Uncharacterized protein n=1 Tax=Octopus bimaculoides TaxID=37653 RepID=A0A0L8HFW1_OCTBM
MKIKQFCTFHKYLIVFKIFPLGVATLLPVVLLQLITFLEHLWNAMEPLCRYGTPLSVLCSPLRCGYM